MEKKNYRRPKSEVFYLRSEEILNDVSNESMGDGGNLSNNRCWEGVIDLEDEDFTDSKFLW